VGASIDDPLSLHNNTSAVAICTFGSGDYSVCNAAVSASSATNQQWQPLLLQPSQQFNNSFTTPAIVSSGTWQQQPVVPQQFSDPSQIHQDGQQSWMALPVVGGGGGGGGGGVGGPW